MKRLTAINIQRHLIIMMTVVAACLVFFALPSPAHAACLPGEAECSGGYCEGECKASALRCTSSGGFVADPSCETLSISSLRHTVTANNAVIEWTTSAPADGRVDFGLSSSYGSFQEEAAFTTSHSFTLTGLEPSTTYYYKVTSVDSDDIKRATVGPRTFTTPASSGTSGGLTISSGPRVDATSAQAEVIFTSSTAAAAMVQYSRTKDTSVTPSSPSACDPTAPCPPPATPSIVFTSHRILITGLSDPGGSTYHYKITLIDSAGTALSQPNLRFSRAGVLMIMSSPPAAVMMALRSESAIQPGSTAGLAVGRPSLIAAQPFLVHGAAPPVPPVRAPEIVLLIRPCPAPRPMQSQSLLHEVQQHRTVLYQ